MASASKLPAPLKTSRKPCLCSSAPGLAVNPSRASIAAKRPLRAVCPTCSGFVIVPKLALMPDASDAAMASLCRARHIQAHQVAAGGGGAEHAQGRGRMPALFVMMEMHAAANPRLGLEAGDIGGDESSAVTVEGLGERKKRREDRRRRMPPPRGADIVENARTRGGAVDRRGIEGRAARIRPEDQPLTANIRGPGRKHPLDDLRAGFPRPGKRHPDRIEDRHLRPIHRLERETVVAN